MTESLAHVFAVADLWNLPFSLYKHNSWSKVRLATVGIGGNMREMRENVRENRGRRGLGGSPD